VARVLAGTARRLQRLVAKRAGEDEDAFARDEPLLAVLAAASLRGRSACGPNAGERWRRLGDRVEPTTWNGDPEASPRVPQHRGLSLHAAVAVPARDHRRLERLCRYVARPPLASDRLEESPDGRLVLRLKTRWRNGTSHILMERSELIDRLVPLISPPRAASRTPASASMTPEIESCDVATNRPNHHRHRWAELLKRVFEIDALRCPRCGSTLRLIAAIEDPVVARHILECLKLPARAPPLEPASRAAISPEAIAPDSHADWEFDQSRPAQEAPDLS
jgi:hypothetical protein